MKEGLYAEIQTNKGNILLSLEFEKCPMTVANFVGLAEGNIPNNEKTEGVPYYDGLKFHRVIDNFMVQGGGFDSDMRQKATNDPITNEANNGLKNDRGTIAMARTMDPHSATAQFFINVSDNDFLNFSGENMQGWGYAVFGRVVEGEDVLDKIRVVSTGSKAGHQDVPNDPIVIESVTVITD